MNLRRSPGGCSGAAARKQVRRSGPTSALKPDALAKGLPFAGATGFKTGSAVSFCPPVLGLVLFLLAGSATSLAQTPRGDPVERLRSLLRAPCRDVAVRDRAVKEGLNSLFTLNDWGKAVILAEWRDRHPEPALAAVDTANRQLVAERFFAGVRQLFREGNVTAMQNTLRLITDLAETARTTGEPPAPMAPLAPDVAQLVRKGPPQLRGQAARTLGHMEPDLAVALPALEELLRSAEPALRQAAMDGLAELLQAVVKITARPALNETVQPGRAEAAVTVAQVLPLVERGLNDWHAGVRRRAVGAVHLAATSLARMIADPLSAEQLDGPESDQLRQDAVAEQKRLRPLVEALAARGPALAFGLREGSTELRLQAQKALEELVFVRERWLQQQAALATSAESGMDDPFVEGFRAALPRLVGALTDSDPRIRRSAIDVLDLLGPAAAPAGKALSLALEDPDRFVRWAAARALSHIGPKAVHEASSRLQRLLADPDPDVRRAAAAALAQIK